MEDMAEEAKQERLDFEKKEAAVEERRKVEAEKLNAVLTDLGTAINDANKAQAAGIQGMLAFMQDHRKEDNANQKLFHGLLEKLIDKIN
jgi:hypothetical protein